MISKNPESLRAKYNNQKNIWQEVFAEFFSLPGITGTWKDKAFFLPF
jgi:hypothetical protein